MLESDRFIQNNQLFRQTKKKPYFFLCYITGVKWIKKNVGNICHAINEWISPFTTTLLFPSPKAYIVFFLSLTFSSTIFRCCQSRKTHIHNERRTIQKSIRIPKSTQKWYLWNLSLPIWSSQWSGGEKAATKRWMVCAAACPPTHVNVCTTQLCNDSHKWKINNKAWNCIFMSIKLNSNIHNWISIWKVNHVEKKVIFRYYCDVDNSMLRFILYLNPLKWLHNIMKYMK